MPDPEVDETEDEQKPDDDDRDEEVPEVKP
jgi:hypothetical protein